MRKYSLTLLVILLALALGLGAVACGSDSPAAKDMTPQELIEASMDAGEGAASQSGTFEVDITIDADASQMAPEEAAMAQALLGQPLKFTGAFASQESPAMADLTVAFGLMGVNMNAGIRVLDENAWVNVLGQWYEAPADLMSELNTSESADMAKTLQEVMDEEGIDPNTWFKDLKTVGTETVGDVETTHLSAGMDVSKMVADVVKMMQNPKFAELLSASDVAGDTGVELPTEADLAEIQPMLEEMFQDMTVDFWIANSDTALRKAVINADLVMPAELATEGLSGIKMLATINQDAPGTKVSVKAPEGAKPFEDLEKDLQSNPLFGSLLGGLMSGGAGDLLAQ